MSPLEVIAFFYVTLVTIVSFLVFYYIKTLLRKINLLNFELNEAHETSSENYDNSRTNKALLAQVKKVLPQPERIKLVNALLKDKDSFYLKEHLLDFIEDADECSCFK